MKQAVISGIKEQEMAVATGSALCSKTDPEDVLADMIISSHLSV